MDLTEAAERHNEHDIRHEIIHQLLCCGHSLHYRIGGKAGRNRILFVLAKNGELPQRELQDMLDIQSGSMSETVKKLESDGLIEKTRSSIDGRNYILRLTDDGAHQAELAILNYYDQVRTIMSGFSPEECAQLNALLSKMQSAMRE